MKYCLGSPASFCDLVISAHQVREGWHSGRKLEPSGRKKLEVPEVMSRVFSLKLATYIDLAVQEAHQEAEKAMVVFKQQQVQCLP